MSDGCVYLVGAGPGDPGLITVRGHQLLSRAEVIVYDYLASPELLACGPADAERIYVGKKAGAHTLRQEEINELLVDSARRGATVVRLKGGDPYVFGRGGEEALALTDAGVEFEVVPGITAGVAAAAYAGIPVTHRTVASNVGLITGHETPDKEGSDLDFEALARWKGTLAFYMGVRNLDRIRRSLVAHGLAESTPCALIRWGTTPRQQVVTGTLADIDERVRAAGLASPALIVVGQVVALRDKLNWFERRALFGRRIVVTRARRQASELSDKLRRLGAEVIEMPTIRIAALQGPGPLREAAAQAGAYDWIVFTSANAVDGFFGALDEAGRDARALACVRLCTVGPATARQLKSFGLRSDVQPATYAGSEVADTLAGVEDLTGAKILCPRSDIAPPDLIDSLAARGADVREVVAYRTVADDRGAETVRDLLGGNEIDWITFTSSSTVRNFLQAVGDQALSGASAALASIGPSTSATLVESGFQPTLQAPSHTIDGLVEALCRADGSRKARP